MNKHAWLPCILISSHKARLRPTWTASYGHRITSVCFQPNLNLLPTRFLSLCSQNLQKSTFYYCFLFSFFQRESRREGVYFLLSKVCGSCWISFGGTMESIWITATSEWCPGKFRAPPLIQEHIQPNVREGFILKIFSEGHLCIKSLVVWIHPTICFMKYFHYHTIQNLLKIWIPSLAIWNYLYF